MNSQNIEQKTQYITDEVITPPHLDEKAKYEESQFAEKDRRSQFWVVFIVALLMDILLFRLFYSWVISGGQNWHMGLMIILPATTILLTMLGILKSHNPAEKVENHQPINSVKIMVEGTKEIISPLIELFKNK